MKALFSRFANHLDFRAVVLNLFSTTFPFSNFPLFHAPLSLNKLQNNVFLGIFLLFFCFKGFVTDTKSIKYKHTLYAQCRLIKQTKQND